MTKLSSLGKTGWQAIRNGLLDILLGLALVLYGHMVPRLGYQLFFTYVFFSAIWSLFSRWFRPKALRENLWVTWAKIILSVILSNSLWLENTTVYLFVFAIAFYQIFIAFVHLVTWYLYRKNGIKPRGRYLFDGLWIGWFGLYSLSPFHNAADFELFLLGWYLISLGITRLRDGIFFEADLSQNKLKRRVRVTLPIFLTALVPATTLAKVNKFLQENAEESAEEAYNQVKSGKTAELELFIHTAETSLFSAIGHVDLCYNGRVISFGNYDPTSERFFGMIGDGVLYTCDRDKYISLCKRVSQKTLFGYGIDLTEDMEKAVQTRLAEIEDLLIPWEPSDEKVTAADGSSDYSYAYRIKHETDGKLYKFTKSKFKSYFVLSTNCVLLADSIVGQAGTDILSPKGFIAPGTYQAYLDEEYEKPNSLVVSKSLY
ncbi:hypothetical protein [Streptococcus plurextorum]|uniref:hypothetical protein n=1 Tax=Streptococcus plurextorum TaxID=456876 RepID=UPI000411CECB|nr:hypothetical protein [Streptococcus plurextorum]